MKSWTKLLLMALLCMGLLCLHAYAESGTCGDNLTWTLDDEGLLTISGTGDMTSRPWEVEPIKRVVIEEGVTGIYPGAFNGCANLEAITIPSSLTSVYYSSFKGCNNLRDLYISDLDSWLNVTYLDEMWKGDRLTEHVENWYLNGEPLREVTLPEGMTSVSDYAFENCKTLESIVIPEGVTNIGSRSFYQCDNLKSVKLPEGVVSIGYNTFYYCINLQSIELPDSLTEINNYALCGCSSLESVTLPDNITRMGESVFALGPSVYYVSSFDTVTAHTLSNGYADSHHARYFFSLKGHPGLTFRYDNDDVVVMGSDTTATSFDIPAGVTRIGSSAFYGFTNLKSIDIPDGVTKIDEKAFINCTSLESVTLPTSLTMIDRSAFYGLGNLSSIELPEGLVIINDSAFYRCASLTLSELPSTLQYIGAGAFQSCTGIESVTFPDVMGYIGSDAFKDCPVSFWVRSLDTKAASALKSAKLPFSLIDRPDLTLQGVTVQEGSNNTVKLALVDSSETASSLVIPDGVEYIENGAYHYSLYIVTLPDSVTGFGDKILRYYSNVNHIVSSHTTSAAIAISKAGGSFRIKSNPDVRLRCVSGNINNVTVVSGAKGEGTVTIPACATSISANAFSGYDKIKSVVTEGRIQSVGSQAFLNCTSLESIDHLGVCTSIGNRAFQGCTALTELTLHNLETIDERAFANCTSLTRLELDECYMLSTIGREAFTGCSSLSYLSLATGVSKVGANALAGCNSLKTIHCTLSSMTLASLQAIGWNHFTPATNPDLICSTVDGEGAKRLVTIEGFTGEGDTVTIPSAFEYNYPLQGIAERAFAGTEGIKKVVIKDGLTAIGSGMFADCADLEEVVLPATLTAIDSEAFSGCPKLASLTLPEGLTEIGDRAFAGCSSLKELSLPKTVTAIDSEAFSGCSSLASLTLPEGLTEIGDRAFSDCAALTEVVFPQSLTTLGDAAFGEGGVTRINMPSALETVTGDASWMANIQRIDLEGCTGLSDVVVKNATQAVYVATYGTDAAAQAKARKLKLKYLPFALTGITMDEELSMNLGDRSQLSVRYDPNLTADDFLEPEVLFESSDEGVVTVDADGKLRAMGGGTATIYARDRLDDFVNASCKVTVTDNTGRKLSSFISSNYANGSGSSGTMGMTYGARFGVGPYTFKLEKRKDTTVQSTQTFTVEPDEDGYVELTASMPVPDDSTQIITMYSLGFDVTDAEGNTAWGALTGMWSIDKYVSGKPHYVFKIASVVHNGTSQLSSLRLATDTAAVALGETRKLYASAQPSSVTPKLVWLSSDYSVVDVEQDGTIRGVAPGSATVTVCATDGTGFRASCEVRCLEKLVDYILLEPGELDETTLRQPIIAQVFPEDASDPSLIWRSENPDIATVDENGVVTWLYRGYAIIVVEAADGSGAAGECGLSWDGIPAQAIELALDPDCAQKLAWSFTPANTTVREVKFQVNNPSVLQVTEQGYLHFLKEGSCEVRAVATDGSNVKSNLLTVSGSPEHDHIFADALTAHPASDGTDGLIGPRTCAVCGETFAETAIPADRSLTLPASLTAVQEEAFAGMAAAQVWIPDGVTRIEGNAFAGCEGLLLARVPSSVTEIDDSAFDGCPNVVLYGAPGSAAEAFAKRRGLGFAAE